MEGKVNDFRLPILTYHHISDEIDYYTCVSPAVFREQIRELTKEGTCIGLEDSMGIYERGESVSGKFALSFDDAYGDTIPALREIATQGLKATVFVATDHIGKDNRWNFKAPYIAPVMTETELRQVASDGHALESHGKTHQCLTKLPNEELRAEITESRRILAELIGREVQFFAYPFGLHDARVRACVAEVYRAAFATNKTAESKEWKDRFQTHRLSVNRDTPLPAILHYLHGTDS